MTSEEGTTKTNGGLFTEERRRRIVELIHERGKLTVNELCHLLNVSPATIRTDLRELDREGLLVRAHGGALENSGAGFEQISSKRSRQNLSAKRAIGSAAATLVHDGDTVLIDTGTTTFELARLLASRRGVTVVTNDIAIARTLEEAPRVEIVLLGGSLRKGYHCTVGVATQGMADGFRVDKAFMATNSLSVAGGAATPDLQQAETKKAMIAIARKVILLCDSSKLGKESFARFAELEDIDTLITERIAVEDRLAFEEHGIEVIAAGR